MFNVVVGIIWQLSLTLIPIYIVIREELSLLVSIAILGITMYILKKNWYDGLKDIDKEFEETIEEEPVTDRTEPVNV